MGNDRHRKIRIGIFAVTMSIIFFMGLHYDFNPERILRRSGGNVIFLIGLIMILYALKAVVMFIPVMALYLAVGAFFQHWFVAVALNLMGVMITVTVGYLNGRILIGDKGYEYMEKYPKLKRINELQTENCTLFTFLVRIMGFIPCDPISVYFGFKKLPYIPYLIGSVAAMAPRLVLTSIMGSNIQDPTSRGFLTPFIAHIAISIVSIFIYYNYKKFRRR